MSTTDVKGIFVSAGTATGTAVLAANSTNGGAGVLTLTAAAATFAQADEGSTTVQKVTLTSTSTDDNSGVTFTIDGTDSDGNFIQEDITGPAASSTVTSTKFYSTVTRIRHGLGITNLSAGVTTTDMHARLFSGRTRVRGMQGVIASAGNLTFRTTSVTGTRIMTLPVTTGALDPYIPDDGVLFTDGAYVVTPTGVVTGLTVFIDK
tara:strand:+ start:456 stop:1073 length:618 start_codon:yes stop_codon:yes gene_type:complete